jgi:hypothetical protein
METGDELRARVARVEPSGRRPTGDVARIVFPPATFDEWDDSQEPPLADE